MIGLLGAILPTVNNVLDRVIPDKNAAAKAQLEIASMAAKGELDQMAGQLKINMKEAENPSLFVAGWRPAIGWIGAFALGAPYFIWFMDMLVRIFGIGGIEMTKEHLPDPGTIMPIVLGMLGIGGARTFERIKGVDRNSLK